MKNPQTRNARTFLPLNISAVGSVYPARCPVTLGLFRPFASGVLALSNPTYALDNFQDSNFRFHIKS